MKFLTFSSILYYSVATLYADTVGPNSAGYTMSLREFESSVVIQPINPRIDAEAPEKDRLDMNQKFQEKQKQEILADDNLREAIRELMPSAVAEQETFFAQVQRELKVDYIRGTDLLKITLRSGDKRFSCDLANRLAERYVQNHKPKNGEQGPIIHEKAVIGVPVDKKKDELEKAAP